LFSTGIVDFGHKITDGGLISEGTALTRIKSATGSNQS
jgi:hypothetical protein